VKRTGKAFNNSAQCWLRLKGVENMTKESFILALAAHFTEAGVHQPLYEAARFMLDNPGMEIEWLPQAAADEWLSAAAEAEDWREPARYGAP
jgi:hypothetical protein